MVARVRCRREVSIGGPAGVEERETDDSQVRASAGSTVPGVVPGGVRSPSSRWPITTRDRNVPPSSHTIGIWWNRAASGDRPSPRPTLRPRYRSPWSGEVGHAIGLRPVGHGRHMTTTPAWMQATAIGSLQHQASSGVQPKRGIGCPQQSEGAHCSSRRRCTAEV